MTIINPTFDNIKPIVNDIGSIRNTISQPTDSIVDNTFTDRLLNTLLPAQQVKATENTITQYANDPNSIDEIDLMSKMQELQLAVKKSTSITKKMLETFNQIASMQI